MKPATPPADALRVMLVERDGSARKRLEAAICADARMLLVDCFAEGAQALRSLVRLRPEVLLLGLRLADLDVAEFVRSARRSNAACEILVIVAPGEEQAALASMTAGAAGCMPRPYAAADLVAQVLQMRAGVCPMISSVARLLFEQLRVGEAVQPATAQASAVHLTARELDVLRLLARGLSYAQASERLGVALNTVGSHVKKAYRKLDVHSAGAAVMRAIQLGLLGEP